jgi:hypothetical protein
VSAINGEEHQSPASATACRPCRGTGRLTSALGGESHQVVCPWCRGTGETIPGINAQDAPAEDGVHGPRAPAGSATPEQPAPAGSGTPDQPAEAEASVQTPKARS